MTKPEEYYEIVRNFLEQTKIRVSYMTLVDCIASVRSRKRYDHDLETMYEAKKAPEIEPSDLSDKLPACRFPSPAFRIKQLDQYLETQNVRIVPLNPKPLTVEFSVRPMQQIHGKFNQSPNYLIEILTHLKIWPRDVPLRNIAIACLADGLGGFASVLNAITQDSVIVYHTKPDRDVVEVYPETITNYELSRGNVINTL